MNSSEIMGALKLGAVVGATNGLVRMAEGGKFLAPFVQAGGSAAVIGYLLKEQDNFVQSAAIAAATGGLCKFAAKQSNEKCMQYALLTGVVSYVAITIVAPELSSLYAKYTSS